MANLTDVYMNAYREYAAKQNANLANQQAAVNQQYANQQAALANQLATSKSGTNKNYDSTAAQNYVNYAKQQNALPEQLRAQGINGGASESALARVSNNYALNQSSNEAARAAAIAQLQNSYDTNLATMKQNQASELAQLQQANAADLAQQYLTAQQNQITYNDTLNQRRLEQYQATMGRFTSVKQVDKALKKLDKNDPNYLSMKWLLQLRKAEIKAAKKGGGGGGGGRSYGGGGGYSSGSTVSSSGKARTAQSISKSAKPKSGNGVTPTGKRVGKTAKKSSASKANKNVWGNRWSK